MAAGTNILLKRKAGAFADGQLAAGEMGIDTTNGVLYFSLDGSTVRRIYDNIIQVVHTSDATQKSTTASFPQDDTIPQSSEGGSYAELDTTITPKFASSNLLINVSLALWPTTNDEYAAGIWRDSGADALSIGATFTTGNRVVQLFVTAFVAAGSVSATTFKVRFACNAGTLYLNDYTTALYGGTVKSSMTIYEIAG